jgi:hypothetical protein
MADATRSPAFGSALRAAKAARPWAAATNPGEPGLPGSGGQPFHAQW